MTAQSEGSPKSTLKTESEPLEVLPVREIKTLYLWKAPSRLFKRHKREFWTTVGSIAFLMAIILFFIQEWLLIVVIAAIIFVYYVFSTVPPEEVEHSITTRGIRFAGREYFWEELFQYWISDRNDQKVLSFETKYRFPGRLELLVGKEDEEKIREILKKYLPEEAPTPSFLDRASTWLSKKIPLEIS